MTHDAERCQRCQQLIRPGAAFCPSCGGPLSNRAARNDRNIDHSQRELMERAAAHGGQIPGSIPVAHAGAEAAGPGLRGQTVPGLAVQGQSVPGQASQGQAVHGQGSDGQGAPGRGVFVPDGRLAGVQTHGSHVQGGGTGMGGKLDIVPAAAGRRLGAAVLDWVGPAAVLVVMLTIGFASITRTQSGGFIIYDTAMLVLLGSIAAGIAVVYTLVLLGIEGRSGNTIGNQLMGIRSTDQDGYAPGAGALFLRGLITGAGLLLLVLATVLVVVFKWFGAALWIIAPLAVLAIAWAFLVVVSNSWDKNAKLRGWHDKAAKTLMFDVNAGRNPVATGGIQGPYSFAPLDLPPVQQVSSPIAGAAVRPGQTVTAQAAEPRQSFSQPAAIPQPPHNPNQWQPPVAPAPVSAPVPVPAQAQVQPQAAPVPTHFQPAPAPVQTKPLQDPASQAPAQAWALHPDDDHDRTQMRGQTVPVPVAVLRIRLDDGREFQLDRTALIGRNPSGFPGEDVAQLLAVADPGRSISKTHLHLREDNGGVWVTDRNSTNGSAVTTPDGIRTALQAGEPAFVRPGSTVHFGDRTFHLGQA